MQRNIHIELGKTLDKSSSFDQFINDIRGCKHCAHVTPKLPIESNPVLQIAENARIRIIGQAPGRLAHETSKTFNDPSGVRLREWLGVDEVTFYNPQHFAITPMAFAFRGTMKKVTISRHEKNVRRFGMTN